MKTAEKPACPDLLSKADVVALLAQRGISITGRTLQKWVIRGLVPEPIRVTHRIVRWPRESLLAALDALAEKTGGPDRAA